MIEKQKEIFPSCERYLIIILGGSTMKKKDLRIEKTKARLYRAQLELMKTKKLEDIKISEICKKAKINRSTFYDHFKDKNILLEELLKDLTKELENDIKLDKDERKIKDYYQILIKKLLEHIDNNKSSYITIIKNNNSPILKEIMVKIIIKESTKEIKKIIVNKETGIDNYICFYANGIIGIIIKELSNEKTYDKDRIYNNISKLLSNNIIQN